MKEKRNVGATGWHQGSSDGALHLLGKAEASSIPASAVLLQQLGSVSLAGILGHTAAGLGGSLGQQGSSPGVQPVAGGWALASSAIMVMRGFPDTPTFSIPGSCVQVHPLNTPGTKLVLHSYLENE